MAAPYAPSVACCKTGHPEAASLRDCVRRGGSARFDDGRVKWSV